MILSWTLRLVCVLIVAVGLVYTGSQFFLALSARWILSRLQAITPRWRERILYLLQIGPALLAAFVAGALFLPAYLRGETNLESEHVSSLCLLIAALMAFWFGSALLRGLRIAFRTLRFARACRRSGQRLLYRTGIPVFTVPDPYPPVGLVGVLRPLILVSAGLMDTTSGLTPRSLGVALDHERSHAVHRDNWKLLTLSFLPRLDRLLPGGDPWMEPWQMAADCAADDEAVRGDPARSLLLAEALVIAARAAGRGHGSRAPYICSALTSAEAGLAARVDRLIHPRLDAHQPGLSLLFVFAGFAVFAVAAACTLSPWIYSLSESLLHLG